MKIRILKKNKERIEFSLEGATPGFANSLRRIIMTEIPVMAIENVEFHQNRSALYDEVLGHRLGMLPLKFKPDKFNFKGDCKCGGDGCTLCQVVFAVERAGPAVVYSGDLKSSNKDVSPTDPKFPLIELLAPHKVKFEATASMGIGLDHSKYQAAIASYKYDPETIVVDGQEMPNKEPKKFLFTVETISGLEPAYIVAKAAEILEQKAQAFGKEAGKL